MYTLSILTKIIYLAT